MELSLEKMMLVLVGLCFAALICFPLMDAGFKQSHDQYAYYQFESLVNSIDGGIAVVLNSTGQEPFQEDIFVPRAVSINSSMNRVSYSFGADSMATTVKKQYPVNVSVYFDNSSGWYSVRIMLENPTLITVDFTHIN